jgi:hypothetical protein
MDSSLTVLISQGFALLARFDLNGGGDPRIGHGKLVSIFYRDSILAE